MFESKRVREGGREREKERKRTSFFIISPDQWTPGLKRKKKTRAPVALAVPVDVSGGVCVCVCVCVCLYVSVSV